MYFSRFSQMWGFKSLPLAIQTITGLLQFDGRHKTEELLTQEGFRFVIICASMFLMRQRRHNFNMFCGICAILFVFLMRKFFTRPTILVLIGRRHLMATVMPWHFKFIEAGFYCVASDVET